MIKWIETYDGVWIPLSSIEEISFHDYACELIIEFTNKNKDEFVFYKMSKKFENYADLTEEIHLELDKINEDEFKYNCYISEFDLTRIFFDYLEYTEQTEWNKYSRNDFESYFDKNFQETYFNRLLFALRLFIRKKNKLEKKDKNEQMD